MNVFLAHGKNADLMKVILGILLRANLHLVSLFYLRNPQGFRKSFELIHVISQRIRQENLRISVIMIVMILF